MGVYSNGRRMGERTAWAARVPGVRDRRGATSLLFVATAIGLLGVVALGTEVGGWYVHKRQGQNVADAAAIAGALAVANSENSGAVVAAGTAAASLNGYTSGSGGVTVTINDPPTSGPHAGQADYVEAIVAQSVNPVIAALFMGPGSFTVQNRAVATVNFSGVACVLAFGGMTIQGSTSLTLNGCSLASNTSINENGHPSITCASGTCSLVSGGPCSGCTAPPVYLTYQPPITNPFQTIYDPSNGTGVTLPTFTAAQCIAVKPLPASFLPWETNGHKAYCGTGSGANATLSLTNGNTLTLTPGNYFLWNASLNINGGTFTCPTCTGSNGVTIILTGSPSSKIGTINITATSIVTLSAPKKNTSWDNGTITGVATTAFDGILFYRDGHAPTGNNDVQINGSASISLNGGMYFPSSDVSISGNMTAGGATCTEIIGDTIKFSGNSGLQLSGCPQFGTMWPQLQSISLVE